MVAGPGLMVLPLVALVFARSWRALAGVTAFGALIFLNAFWALPLLGFTQALPAPLLWPAASWVMVSGHFVAAILLLIAFGVFTPAAGSPADLALRSARRGDHLAAGEFWLEAGKPRRALRSFVRARAFVRAADLARTAGKMRLAAELYQREGGAALSTAAQILARLGDEAGAQQLSARAGKHLVESRQPEAAIEHFLRAGDPRRAAHALDLALSAGRLTPAHADLALRAAREARKPALGASAAMACGRWHEAGELFLACEEPLEAARAFERAGETMRAAEALRMAGNDVQAARLRARRAAAAGQLEQAAADYEQAGLLAEAAEVVAQLGRHERAIDLYRRAHRHRDAAELAAANGDPVRAAELFGEAGDWLEAGNAYENAGDLVKAAHCYERSGDFDRALQAFQAAGMPGEQSRVLLQLGRHDDALLLLLAAGEHQQAWTLVGSGAITFSPALSTQLLELADWLGGRGDITAAISLTQRLVQAREGERDSLPACYTLAELLERHGDLRGAEAAFQRVVDLDYGYRDAAARLQSVATRRAQAEGSISGAFRVPEGPAPDATARYTLGPELGRGGMGVVYQATDERLARSVAIKILNPRQHTPEALKRFEREARAAAALSHPGIVHIYDFDRGFNSYYIAMEYVSGPTLNQLLRDEAAFVEHNLLALMRQIADAVAYAHSRHVVHRDLKPANMVLADRKQIKILDFGIARRLDEDDRTATGATGTPYYMAPEQILGEDPDERTDVYSLGVTFFQMATGNLPFASGNILRSHLDAPPPDPRSIRADLDPAVAALVLKCMGKGRDERYRDGASLAQALSALALERAR